MCNWSSTPNVHEKQVSQPHVSIWNVRAITLVKKRQEKNLRALSGGIGRKQGNEEEGLFLQEGDL